MMKTLCAAATFLCLTGCHHRNMKYVEFVLNPDSATKSVAIDCRTSDTEKCHFAFAGSHPTEVSLETGHSLTVTEITPGTLYCAGSRKPSLDTCKQASLPTGRTTIRNRSTVTSEAGD